MTQLQAFGQTALQAFVSSALQVRQGESNYWFTLNETVEKGSDSISENSGLVSVTPTVVSIAGEFYLIIDASLDWSPKELEEGQEHSTVMTLGFYKDGAQVSSLETSLPGIADNYDHTLSQSLSFSSERFLYSEDGANFTFNQVKVSVGSNPYFFQGDNGISIGTIHGFAFSQTYEPQSGDWIDHDQNWWDDGEETPVP